MRNEEELAERINQYSMQKMRLRQAAIERACERLVMEGFIPSELCVVEHANGTWEVTSKERFNQRFNIGHGPLT